MLNEKAGAEVHEREGRGREMHARGQQAGGSTEEATQATHAQTTHRCTPQQRYGGSL
jgi:hypothetical protein